MDHLIKYIKLTFWVIGLVIRLFILVLGTNQLVTLILHKNLHIYWSDLNTFITICVVIAFIFYWSNLTNSNEKFINLIYEINERYKIIQQISKDQESANTSASVYEPWRLIGMEMDIKQAIERRNKSLWWYSIGKRSFKW